jgi:hypothetical protein
MNPTDDELERRLRDAFAAKAHQVTPDDLDADREAEFADRLTVLSAAQRKRRIFAGVGIVAAAAAAAGIVALAVLPDHQRPVNAAQQLSSSSASKTSAASAVTSGGSSAGGRAPQAAQPSSGRSSNSVGMTQLSGQPTLSTTATPGSSASSAASDRSALSESAPNITSHSTAPAEPPTLPSGLPQAGSVNGGTTYAGPVPLPDQSGGADRMLNLPDGTKWQVAAQDDHSMTVHLTFQPTDVAAYWTSTLPADGWTRAGDGWQFPDSSYTVGAIDDSGTFTVTW